MTAIDWRGVANIMVTPFTEDENIDVEGVGAVTRWAVEAGVDMLVPLGIMGEAHKLTDTERDVVLRGVVEAADGTPVVAGCTAESTRAVIVRAERAAELGASAVMVAPPRAAAGPELQRRHYEAVAAASPLPVVLQDEPVTTGVRMAASTIGEIGRLDRIAAVKVEEVPSPTKVSGILAANPDLPCFGGLGGLYMVEELDRGAVGIMTGFGFPEVLVAIHRAYASGDREEAQRIFWHAMPLIRYEAQLGVGGVSIRKKLLAERGVIATPAARQPVAAGDPEALPELRRLVAQLKL
ncbi:MULTISPECIES: dihydrodipicolinate synthase family protein [unclassified Streptomyces]|uniref:dihydrodipicolinate synthase family protein n=1 Tax=unclassified Streptomyces TaxID=2593676 RepID=UPI0036E2CAC7